MLRLILPLVALGLASGIVRGDEPNLVTNGSFEEATRTPGVPDAWATAGARSVHQQLTQDAGREAGHSAKLACTAIEGDGPDVHAMLCQVNRVGVTRGTWYRLTFWARGEALKPGPVDVSLVDTKQWEGSGLSEAFTPTARWQRFEMLFQARAHVSPTASRLQFWFRGTGTLWLDDVALVETTGEVQYHPQIAFDGAVNAIPNSSFECGTAGWGSITYGIAGWGGNLYRLEASERDHTTATHGKYGLKITLHPDAPLVYRFDYYEPVRQPIRRILAANRGWIVVEPGKPLTLSVDLKADADDTPAQLAVIEAPDRWTRKAVRVGTAWKRHELTFTPRERFVFVAVGIDLEGSDRKGGTLWLDAVQLERSERATAFAPRQPIGVALELDHLPVTRSAAKGARIRLHAFNDSDWSLNLRSTLKVRDFFDRVRPTAEKELLLSRHSGVSTTIEHVEAGHLGSFRAGLTWSVEPSRGISQPPDAPPIDGRPSTTPEVRFAIVDGPAPADSAFGFNHAFPWNFLVDLSNDAGVRWWRDWSAKWQTVEPEKGRWDFSVPDDQIRRLLVDGRPNHVVALLPFPSTTWSTTAKPEDVEKAAGRDGYLRSRLPVAYAPRDLEDFGRYAAKAAAHYLGFVPRALSRRQPNRVDHVQILNEPVYTDYALPRKFGYSLDDYINLLKVAHRAVKQVDPACVVVGGLSANLASGYTTDFVKHGGLEHLDVFDLHMYDPPRPAESFEEGFRGLEELMRAHGGTKPIWITEWGCYADDDPAVVPQSVGDATMNRCRWPSERAATEHIVKFTAVSFAHGVRRIFFHAGTCGTINGPDAGSVLFEYGGAPRKMYAGVAALSRILGVPDSCERIVDRDGLHAYVFRSGDHSVAIAWDSSGRDRTLKVPGSCRAVDVMGNALGPDLAIGETPVYVVGPDAEVLVEALSR